MKTYTTMAGSAHQFVADARLLYKVRSEGVDHDVDATMRQLSRSQAVVKQHLNRSFEQLDVLVVGAGQTRREVIAFGLKNRVTAIDLDVIPVGWAPAQYVQLFKTNGATRTAKTVGRKLLGIDRRFESHLLKALDCTNAPNANYLQMTANAMEFPENSFDVVFSFSVFEHLDDPNGALAECVRVLRPGGLLDISTHIYSAEGGCHDLRIFSGNRDEIPFWAQLRPAVKSSVRESCFMNEWTLAQWTTLFERHCQGVEFEFEPHHDSFDQQLRAELATLRESGELADYSDDELLTVNVKARWVKPTNETRSEATSEGNR
jgi:SAM-dependent methyltransferase